MLNIKAHFPLQGSFLDPQLTKDGKPYGPWKYKQIVQERWYISKNINTSYTDVGKITPIEREYLAEFIVEDLKRNNEMLKQSLKQKSSNQK